MGIVLVVCSLKGLAHYVELCHILWMYIYNMQFINLLFCLVSANKNDNCVFPKCKVHTYHGFGEAEDNEWLVDNIITHQWKGNKVSFLVQWNLGDTTWELYSECKSLLALDHYLELLGLDEDEWQKLPRKSLTTEPCLSHNLNEEAPKRCKPHKRK